jgi:hypothetical protein
MGQPVKISDKLLLEARQVSAAMNRSIAGQIEHWARLGQVIEPVLTGDQTHTLARAPKGIPLSAVFASIGTKENQVRFEKHLDSQPFPHFEATGNPGVFIKIDRDGTRTKGRFEGRTFRPLKSKERALAHA